MKCIEADVFFQCTHYPTKKENNEKLAAPISSSAVESRNHRSRKRQRQKRNTFEHVQTRKNWGGSGRAASQQATEKIRNMKSGGKMCQMFATFANLGPLLHRSGADVATTTLSCRRRRPLRLLSKHIIIIITTVTEDEWFRSDGCGGGDVPNQTLGLPKRAVLPTEMLVSLQQSYWMKF